MNTRRPAALALRPVTDQDIKRLTAWLHEEHVRKWYHEPNAWLREINGRHGEYSWIHHFIVMDGDAPIGFCQYYDCCDAGDLESWYSVTRRGETFSMDYLLGDAAYLGKGYGTALVGLLTETIWREERPQQIIVQPDDDNLPSCRALLANGYQYDAEMRCYRKILE